MSVLQGKRETTNVQIDRIERHKRNCSAGGCCNCCCKKYYCSYYLLCFMMLAIIGCGLVPLYFLYSDSGDAAGYYDNETRLMKVSAFFRDRVEISVNSEERFTANATLYLVQETPQLIPGDYITENISVSYYNFDVNYENYYLKTNSTITLSACKPSDCDPFFLFIMKDHEFNKWKNSPSGEAAGERHQFVKKDCSEGSQQLNYTVTDNTFYYLVTYAPTSCYDDDKRTATAAISRYEYSVNSVTVSDSCRMYEFPSCLLKVPLGFGYARALVVAGHDGGDYDISFSTSSRVWACYVVIIPTLCLLLVPIICCLWCCVRRRRRNSYNRLS